MNTRIAVAPNTDNIARSTLLLVLMAETAFFGTLLMTFLFMRTALVSVSAQPLALFDKVFASLNTGVLFLSVLTARQAESAIRRDSTAGLKTYQLYSLILGAVFVAGQLFEFGHSGMTINDAFLGGIYFALIGFHALHVLAGMTVLVINYIRTQRGDFTSEHFAAVWLGTRFWYYVAAVWGVLFVALYLV